MFRMLGSQQEAWLGEVLKTVRLSLAEGSEPLEAGPCRYLTLPFSTDALWPMVAWKVFMHAPDATP